MISIKETKRKCKDDISLIENYEQAINDKTQTWECHHRLELTLEGEFAHSKTELKRLGMYYKRPYFELIFLTISEHKALHKRSEETKRKMSESHKGKSSGMKGKKLSDEQKKNISKGKEGRTYSEFGRKFKEHFGITRSDNLKQYDRELHWYHKHGHCRWED